MATKVVHCKKDKYDIYIGRPSKWGNPFILDRENDRQAVIRKYTTWLRQQHTLLKQIHELKDKVLGCWCAPKMCHGDVLAKLADMHGRCTVCNWNWVDVDNGYDTCDECLSKQ